MGAVGGISTAVHRGWTLTYIMKVFPGNVRAFIIFFLALDILRASSWAGGGASC